MQRSHPFKCSRHSSSHTLWWTTLYVEHPAQFLGKIKFETSSPWNETQNIGYYIFDHWFFLFFFVFLTLDKWPYIDIRYLDSGSLLEEEFFRVIVTCCVFSCLACLAVFSYLAIFNLNQKKKKICIYLNSRKRKEIISIPWFRLAFEQRIFWNCAQLLCNVSLLSWSRPPWFIDLKIGNFESMESIS